MEFRLLRADEIDVRIAMVQSWGISLLLYKDARCDQNILDETVGSMNWQRHHNRDNANCIVSIWDEAKQQWIEKEDTGTESNTEREKGLASDSFKRACFNWGIGRELYTSPAMFVKPNKLKTFKNENGRFTCKDRFRVNDIIYSGKKIVKVDVLNESTGEILVFGETPEEKQKEQEVKEKQIGKVKGKALEKMLTDAEQDIEKIKAYYKFTKFEDLTEQQHQMIVSGFQKAQEGKNGRKRTN